MSNIYNFPYSLFPDNTVNLTTLTDDVRASSITKALDYTSSALGQCSIAFKAELSDSELATLSGIVNLHDSSAIPASPKMADGRPIIRADTRPLEGQTYFTSSGDDPTASGAGNVIGGGVNLRWDFSNSNNDMDDPSNYTEHDVTGMKGKVFDMVFVDNIWPKDGAIYHWDQPWGCFVEMQIVCPPGYPYEDPNGVIPASALGLSGNKMYTIAADYTPLSEYLHKFWLYETNQYGDELNAEGCTVDPVPPGYIIRGMIFTLESDNVSKGFASFEMYRKRTILLPGEEI